MFLSSSEVELYILTEVLGLPINMLAVIKDVQRHTLSSDNVARARIHRQGISIWQGCQHCKPAIQTLYKLSSFLKSAGGIESERQ